MSSHDAAVVEEGPIGPPHIHHMDPPTAYAAAKLGMWLFLATEILLFGGLFAAFAMYRWMYIEQFHHAADHLNWKLGATNTAVLLISSYFAAIAVDAAQHGNNKKVSSCLMVTIGCGAIFLVIKYFEYKAKYDHGLFPSFGGPNGIEFDKYKAYFGLYYCMTGLHGLHVVIGMAILAWVLKKSMRNRFSPDYYTPVEVGALYWHLVDLIWIYLFPLLYLVG
jgi:cytochrome c oxidase subunit III